MAALLMVPIIGAVGLAFDYTNMLTIEARLSDSLDAAAFEAAKLYMKSEPDSVISERAGELFAADLGQFVGQGSYSFSYDGVATDDGANVVKVSASVKYDPTFMPVFWHMLGQQSRSLSVARQSEVSLSASTVEVALVLDNSGSMYGEKIASLKEAADDLVDRLFASAAIGDDQDAVRMSIVPFAASVNVGSNYADATWMDTTGVAKYHHENFDWTTIGGVKQADGSWEKNGQKLTRFWLYNKLGVSWGGCVEARPYPYNVDNTVPDPANPDTLFVPMFAPDEPDSGHYPNNYLDDGLSGGYWRNGKWYPGATDEQRLRNMAKYLNGKPNYRGSPNRSCTSDSLLPMTNNKDAIKQKINELWANGNTDTTQGAAWGLHTLTPGGPFDGPRDFGAKGNIKAMVIMTDGENTYDSSYAAFGYASAGHGFDGTTYAGNTDYRNMPPAMDQHLTQVCSAAKDAGVMVFTIAFDVSSANIKQRLQDCASDNGSGGKLYFDAQNNGSDLQAAFGVIGAKISALRLYR